jgi:hypothetical protein
MKPPALRVDSLPFADLSSVTLPPDLTSVLADDESAWQQNDPRASGDESCTLR